MKRRTFLKQTAAAGATAIVSGAAPAVVHASKETRGPVIGQGEHKYECIHDWGQLPSHLQWQTTHGVAIDRDGLVYIKQQGWGSTPIDTILVFDPKGAFVRSFGKEYHGGGHGIDIRRDGGKEYLYLCDTKNGQVVKTDLKGEVVWKLGEPKESNLYPQPGKYRPTNLAFAPDGGFYVGDGYGSHYIHQYDRDQKWVRSWGGVGEEPGKMKTPHGIWLDSRPGREPSLVVADRGNGRLQYFTLDGKHIGFVSDLLFPAHFDIRGGVLLVPDLYGRVSLFDKDNKPLVHLGHDPAWTEEVKKRKIRMDPALWPPGKFVHPHDACFDKDGNIFVVEWVHTGRVTKLRRLD